MLFKVARRFVLALTLTTVFALAMGNAYVEAWTPWYKVVTGWLLPDFRVIELARHDQFSDRLIALTIDAVHPFVIGTKYIAAGASLSASTLAGHAVQHVVVVLVLLLVWPLGSTATWRDRAGLLILALPALALIECLDIPFVLAGAVDDLLLSQFAPSEWSRSWLVRWMNFLNGGGRLALSGVVTLVAIGGYRARCFAQASRPLKTLTGP